MLSAAHSWAAEAGAIALGHFNVVAARRKPDRSVVTAADEEIETLLRARIAAAFPEHGIVGEEQGRQDADREFVWALDPIDGTSAFVSGLPHWGISIGLLQARPAGAGLLLPAGAQ